MGVGDDMLKRDCPLVRSGSTHSEAVEAGRYGAEVVVPMIERATEDHEGDDAARAWREAK